MPDTSTIVSVSKKKKKKKGGGREGVMISPFLHVSVGGTVWS